VLTDFVAGICKKVGYDYPGTYNWPEGWTYDMFEAAGTSREEADKLCDINFWANLDWMEDGRDILKAVLDRFKPHEIVVLTKPMRNSGAYTGKMIWFENNIPQLYDRVVPSLVPKEVFAVDFNTLLVDDCQENIEQFIRAGGAGILVPRPWNKQDQLFYSGKAVSYVARMLDKWIRIANHPARSRKEQHV